MIAAPAAVAVSGVQMPPLISSCGASLVSSRVCGSTMCQHAAALGTTRRKRAVTSA
jgi:hypothetical protein